MFYGLTNRKSEPDSTGGAPNGFRRLADTWAQALASIKAARPSIAAERREQAGWMPSVISLRCRYAR